VAGGAMNGTGDVLLELAWRFASLSLFAIGGINALLPEIQRIVVDVERWMSAPDFVQLFALAQLAPGPNAMIVALVGWKVAGIPGALVSTIAVCGPSSVVCYLAVKGWDRMRTSKWRAIVQQALAPIAIGLVFASGYTLARAADHTPGAFVLTAIAAAAIAFTRVNPVWVLGAAALCGMAGLA